MLSLRRMVALAAAITGLLTSCNVDDPQLGSDSLYSVVITQYDRDSKIQSIKAIREETGLGLADAKRLIEGLPGVIKAGLNRSDADALAARLRAHRMTVEIQTE